MLGTAIWDRLVERRSDSDGTGSQCHRDMNHAVRASLSLSVRCLLTLRRFWVDLFRKRSRTDGTGR